jgi:hypothetical protein
MLPDKCSSHRHKPTPCWKQGPLICSGSCLYATTRATDTPVSPVGGHVYGVDTFCRLGAHTPDEQANLGGVALQVAGRWCQAPMLHRGFVNFAIGRDARFVMGRPYLPKRRVATNMTPTENTSRLNITRIAWTAFIFKNTLTQSSHTQHSGPRTSQQQYSLPRPCNPETVTETTQRAWRA